MFDYVILNGIIIDGSGNDSFKADLGIKNNVISAIGDLENCDCKEFIDAKGKIVCPGFIDCHSHTDATILINPLAQSTVRQGVTTEITGNCGNSFAPVTKISMRNSSGFGRFKGVNTFECSFGEFLEKICQMGTSINLGWFAGHNTLRSAAGVSGSMVTKEQIKEMKWLLAEAMDSGALGISTGLEFEPGRSASKEEIIELSEIVSGYGGYYASHIRNRDAKILDAIDEFIEIVRDSKTRGQVSHLNVRYNTGASEDAWDRAVEKIQKARLEGLDIFADMTPLEYGIGQMAAILPERIRKSGHNETVRYLIDPNQRKSLVNECDRYWRFISRGEWHRVRMQSNPAFPEINGLTFPQISELWKKDCWDCYFDILAAAGPQMDAVVLVAELFTPAHLKECISNPLFMLAVDGFSTINEGLLSEQTAFPLHYMGMIHFLTCHVRERKTLTLEEAIRKMTGMPANRFGIKKRGFIKEKYIADVVIFDYNELDDVSTIEKPLSYCAGVEYVFVNGTPVIYKGEHTGARPGVNILR